jgi:hypothetical protein
MHAIIISAHACASAASAASVQCSVQCAVCSMDKGKDSYPLDRLVEGQAWAFCGRIYSRGPWDFCPAVKKKTHVKIEYTVSAKNSTGAGRLEKSAYLAAFFISSDIRERLCMQNVLISRFVINMRTMTTRTKQRIPIRLSNSPANRCSSDQNYIVDAQMRWKAQACAI